MESRSPRLLLSRRASRVNIDLPEEADSSAACDGALFLEISIPGVAGGYPPRDFRYSKDRES